jgi:hypothetical protein
MFFGGGRSNENEYEYYSSELDDSDEEFEDALENCAENATRDDAQSSAI